MCPTPTPRIIPTVAKRHHVNQDYFPKQDVGSKLVPSHRNILEGAPPSFSQFHNVYLTSRAPPADLWLY